MTILAYLIETEHTVHLDALLLAAHHLDALHLPAHQPVHLGTHFSVHPVVEQALRLGDQLAGHLAGHQAVTLAVHRDSTDHLAVLLQYAFQFN